MKKEIGLYVHVPFCVKKCVYCDFASFAGREQDEEKYVDAVLREAERRSGIEAAIATLYIGGGTPSVLPPALMDRLLSGIRQSYSFLLDAECSCECNPGTVTEAFFAVLRRNGVNRLSFGAQAAQPRLLSLLGRIHTWREVRESVEKAKRAGFENINLDLMLGLPTQTLKDVRETLDAALALSPTHLSCYGLIVEEGTEMHRRVESGEWTLPDEDTEREMYECCRETLLRRGFEQYEISNFSLPGFACRHNEDCWKRREYIGLGSAACGFWENTRYQNPPLLSDYLAGKPAQETVISPEEARFESMMLGLRMMEGVSDRDFYAAHGVTISEAYGKKLEEPMRRGLITWKGDRLCLTRRGMDVQNSVLVELL
ncbi:MAG: radical SAM family heme chaperone HemW [Clostridia bacterium]|nr:radical SAM family heme chaperone HemW [Clostridia bacterium]